MINLLKIASLLGALGVGLGAFGAHLLQKTLGPMTVEAGKTPPMQVYKTAVEYQMVHVLAIFAAAILFRFFNDKWLIYAGWSFVFGILIFSGSLYGMSFARAAGAPMNWLGAITPIGGLLFIAGWLLLAKSVWNAV